MPLIPRPARSVGVEMSTTVNISKHLLRGPLAVVILFRSALFIAPCVLRTVGRTGDLVGGWRFPLR